MAGGIVGRVFVDANVLYSRTQRDWLGLLYTDPDHDPPFEVFWSEDVLAEAIRSLRKDNPTWDGAKIAAVRDHIAATFEVGRVTEFIVDGSYRGGDLGDAHVHAASVACAAQYLLTNNVKHFSVDEPDRLTYEIVHPDVFFMLVDDSAPCLVDACITRQIAYWHQRTQQVDLDGALRRADCPGFADRVLHHLQRRALVQSPHHH